MSLILTLALWFQTEPQCQPGYIHYPPLCLTEQEYLETVTPPPPVIVDTEAEVRVIAAYFWPDWAAERMVRIAKCETVPDWNARSLNPSSGAAGLWQIMPFWKKVWPGDYFDPWTNGAVAYQIWLEQGFSAWVCKGT